MAYYFFIGIADKIAKMIGHRIKQAREKSGITQAELARRVGVSQPTVSDWENGVTDPIVGNLEAIALELDISFEWLGTGRGEMDYRLHAAQSAADYVLVEQTAPPPSPEAVLPRRATNDDILRYVIGLNIGLAESAATHSRSLQILTFAIAKQLNGSDLLMDIKNALERVRAEGKQDSTLPQLLENMIGQIMRAAKE